MIGANVAIYSVPPAVPKSGEAAGLPLREFSIKRTAASEELAIFERTSTVERSSSQWLDSPPLLKPGKKMQVKISYTFGGLLEFPPLSEEDEQAMKSTGLE